MISTELLLHIREVVTVLALIYATWLLSDSRKYLEYPWPFLFILLRLIISAFLRGAMVLNIPLGDFLPEFIKTIATILDLATLITIHKNFPRLSE